MNATIELGRWALGAVAGLALAAPLVAAQTRGGGAAPSAEPEPIQYTVSFPAPQTHYLRVEARVPTDGRPQVELMMAVWTPGSYLVREYEKHLEQVVAATRDGRVLPLEKTRKNRWRIVTQGAPVIVVTYQVYAREMGVRSNWVEDGFAMLNGAPTFLTLAESRRRAHEVTVQLPAGWQKAMTALPDAPDGVPHHFHAPDFDTLVDSPIVAGNPAVYEWEIDGKKHYLVNTGEGGFWDGKRAAADLEKIVRQARVLWGSLPYEKYVFLNMITESGGGIEHKGSTVLMSSRYATRTRKSYLGFLRLASHEYFHAWNVKRLRPVELGPFDYENEVYTTGLWISEGFTDYYGAVQLRRAGLQTDEEFLEQISGSVQELQTTPGRLVQPVQMSSYDAWIKQYRPDENSSNTSISYYTKGAVLAWVLDAKIRHLTDGQKSLDDVMRVAYQRYAGARGFTAQQFRDTASEVAGTKLDHWFAPMLETTAEVEYDEALEWFGLHFKSVEEREGRAVLGAVVRVDNGRTLIGQVRRGTPAFEAGLDAEDEILAVDDVRVRAGQLDQRLEQYKPGNRVRVTVARRDLLRSIDVTLGAAPGTAWSLAIRPDAGAAHKARFTAWTGESAE